MGSTCYTVAECMSSYKEVVGLNLAKGLAFFSISFSRYSKIVALNRSYEEVQRY